MNCFRFIERGINAEVARQERDPRRRRRGRPGDAALRPRQRRDHLAALEGGGARLPLLPRARPRAGRDRRGDARAAARGDCPSCPRRARSASRRELRPHRGERERCSRSAASSATSSRRRSPPTRRAAPRSDARQLGRPASSSRASARARTRPTRASRRPRWRRSSALVARQAGERGRRPRRCSTARRRRRGPRGDRRGRGARGDRATTASSTRIVAAALAANADAAERVRAGNAEAIGADRRRSDARDQGPRGRRRGHAARARAARHLSRLASLQRPEHLGPPGQWHRRRPCASIAAHGPPQTPTAADRSTPRRFILLARRSRWIDTVSDRGSVAISLTSVGQRALRDRRRGRCRSAPGCPRGRRSPGCSAGGRTRSTAPAPSGRRRRCAAGPGGGPSPVRSPWRLRGRARVAVAISYA